MGFHLSTCPYCSFGCRLVLHTENGRLVGSHPSASHAVGNGSLCMRGWNCVEAPYDRSRLTAALVRKDGCLTRASIGAAVDEIGTRLSRIHSAPPRGGRRPSTFSRTDGQVLFVLGPAVANEDLIAGRRLAAHLRAEVCSAEIAGVRVARDALRTVLGRGYSARTLDVLAEAKVIWLFGVDVDNCPQVASRLVHARRRGAALVEFDIRATSSRPGVRTVRIPPGRFGVVPALLQQAAFDLDVVPPRLRNVPQFSSVAKPSVPGRGPLPLGHDWLTDGLARELVQAFVAVPNAAIVIGDRWLGSLNAEEQTIQLLQAMVLLGAEDRVVIAAGEANSWGGADLLPASNRSPLVDLLSPDGHDPIRALFIVGDDLMRRTPRPDALARRLSEIETVVLLDRFETDCLPFADVVLPCAVFAEQDSSVTNCLGMVQRWHEVVAPPGDARTEREWFEAIGRRLGLAEWPAGAGEWLRAAGSANAAYSSRSLDALYGDDPVSSVSLEDHGRITFVEPTIPPVAARAVDYPLHLYFRPHPAFWSTGVLSEREQLLRREATESCIWLSPDDLQRTRLRDGSVARVVTPYGEVVLTVRGDPSLAGGVAVVTALARSCVTARPEAGTAAVAADGGQMRGETVLRVLRDFQPDVDGRTIATEPVPGRIEPV
jgi:formate dehydrogenase major subunit